LETNKKAKLVSMVLEKKNDDEAKQFIGELIT